MPVSSSRAHARPKATYAVLRISPARVATDLSDAEAAALGVGLKLMSAVVLEHRRDPIFSSIHTALGDFIRALKAKQ